MATDIIFTKGVPARVSVKSLVPAGDRYQGGYFDVEVGYHSYARNLVGVTFDAVTCELVYNGADPNPYGIADNPSVDYWVGSEAAPYNSHWQWPPTACPLPQPVAGVSRSLANSTKHTSRAYCPIDQCVYLFGGDFSTFGLLEEGQNGRAMLWKWHPITNVWTRPYDPPGGLAGDVMPLSPDIMGMVWDAQNSKLFISWGNARPGFDNAAQWASYGHKATVYPPDCNDYDLTHYPCFTFDPFAARPKYELAPHVLWDVQNSNQVHDTAYDSVSKRVLAVQNYGSAATTLYALDRTNPAAQWTAKAIGLPGIFTGGWPIMVDEAGRRLLFIDCKDPTLYAYTLIGHALGEGVVQVVCKLPVVSLNTAAMGLTASIGGEFIPEHRSVVLMWEPLWHNVSDLSSSLTINVDTGVITDGPRFPSYDTVNRPWFPGKLLWYPPTQELLAFSFMYDQPILPNVVVPQINYRYKWVP